MALIWQFWRERRRDEDPMEARAFLAEDYRITFGSPMGQRVLADILRRAGVMQTTFDAHPPTAAFNEGRRRIGLEIIEMINADPAPQQAMATTGNTEELFR